MRKTIIILTCMLSLWMLAGCGKDMSPEGIKKRGELVVATNAEFPPFEYFGDNNKITGFDMDLAQEIAQALGVTIKINHMDFDAVLAAVSSGKADMALAGLTVSEERKKSVSFSKGYFTASQVVIIRNNYALTASSKDELDHSLIGKSIGVQRGTVGYFYAKGDPGWGFAGITNAVVKEYDSGSLAVTDLVGGRVDAVIIDEMPARILVTNISGTKIVETGGTAIRLTDEEYAIAVKHDNTALIDFLNATLDQLKTVPQGGKSVYQQLLEKYFGA